MLETNSLVEEFMLLANCSVAAKIQDTFPQTAVLRRHGWVHACVLKVLERRLTPRWLCNRREPPKTNFENLDDLLFKRRGMHLDASSSAALADSLDRCVVSRRSLIIAFFALSRDGVSMSADLSLLALS